MIHIYSIQFNKPQFIEVQKKSFDKFCTDYKFTIIDNSIDLSITKEIHSICDSLELEYIETVNKFDTSTNQLHGISHEVGVRLFLDRLKNHHTSNDVVMLLDHDLIFISPISQIEDLINESSILSRNQTRQHLYYVWPGLSIYNLKNCVNINELNLDGCQLIDGQWQPVADGVFADVGGHSYHYLKKYKDELKYVDITKYFVESREEVKPEHIFYHFENGSQWSNYPMTEWESKFEKMNNILR